MNLPNFSLIGFLLLAAASCVAQEAQPAAEEFTRATLVPERAPADGEALWLEVSVGALPAQSSLEIRDAAGVLVGAVAPFGQKSREQGSRHLVPLPAALQGKEPIELRVQVVVSGEARRPSGEELRDLQLVYVPASK